MNLYLNLTRRSVRVMQLPDRKHSILAIGFSKGGHSNIYYITLHEKFLGLYRISAPAPAGIRHFFQIRQKSGSSKNPTGAG